MHRSLTVLALLLLVAGPLVAQRQTPQVSIPESLLTPQQKAALDAAQLQDRVAQYGKWVGLGDEIGKAVNSSLSAVTTQASNFANTNVGKITVALVVWKVIGTDITQLFVGLGWFVIFIISWQWAMRKWAMDHKVLSKVNADKSKEYTIVKGDNDWRVGLWLSLFGALVIGLIIIFA